MFPIGHKSLFNSKTETKAMALNIKTFLFNLNSENIFSLFNWKMEFNGNIQIYKAFLFNSNSEMIKQMI